MTAMEIPAVPAEQLSCLLERMAENMYAPVACLRMTAWRTSEPIPFAQRTEGERMELSVGDLWGRELFDCAWFRFCADIPQPTPAPLFVRIDINGELLLVDDTGHPMRGLTCVRSTFDRTLGKPGKTIFALPPRSIRDGRLELWGDAGLNDLFGSITHNGTIEWADLCVCRPDLRALYYDLSVLVDFRDGLHNGGELESVLAELVQELDLESAYGIAAARKRLLPFFQPSAPRTSLRVHAIGHAHLDLAWLWPIRESIRKAARTFSSAQYNLDRYPDYTFGASQAEQFAWIKTHYPTLYRDIQDAVSRRRIELLGGMWVEPDCNLPSGESLVRQIMHGTRFFREEFGIEPHHAWLPDTFGYNAQLPQILKKSGLDYFVTQKLSWNLVNRFPYYSFHWEGLDGTTLLAHLLPEETYNGPAAPRSLRKIAKHCSQQNVSDHALMVYGIGDGGGGPDAEHLERLARIRHLADLPAVTPGRVDDFFTQWEADAANFPTWRGELYLERHQGTYTTQAATKRNNRRAEIALRELEWAAVLGEMFAGIPYPAEELDSLWKEVLLYQFHDILPGSSIKRVYDECTPRYADILARLDRMIQQRYASLGPGAYNSLPWRRQEWIRVDGHWHWADIPAMGCAPLASVTPPSPTADDRHIENEHLCVRFADDGTICSLIDKATRQEILAPNTTANCFVVFKDTGDAWDFPQDYNQQIPQTPTLIRSTPIVDGPLAVMEQEWRFNHSIIHQRIELKTHSRQLEFDTTVDWHETSAMLRVRFPVNVSSREARFEIPFGSLGRVTHEDDSCSRAQIETCAQQWVDLSQPDFGVTLLNDCKYGFRIKGHTLDMNLIRSVPHPNTALIAKDDISASPANNSFTDQGQHLFRYAILPHSGIWTEGDCTAAARVFNTPLRCVPGTGEPRTFFEFNGSGIEITAIKRAEDGRGVIVRLCRVEPTPSIARFQPAWPVQSAVETDPMERDLHSVDLDALEFKPFEIKTVRIQNRQATSTPIELKS